MARECDQQQFVGQELLSSLNFGHAIFQCPHLLVCLLPKHFCPYIIRSKFGRRCANTFEQGDIVFGFSERLLVCSQGLKLEFRQRVHENASCAEVYHARDRIPRVRPGMTRDHILREIRRTAEANGGAPLGSRSFFKETGIKEADWKGKLWARWNDAVREAGFEPNQLQQPFEETPLIEKFIPLMRKFGRFPVTTEMRMQKRDDASFPNEKTLRDRFGTQKQFAAKILAYCEGHDGLRDIVTICTAAMNAQDTEPEDGNEPEGDIGFVYLVKSGRFYKIGRSNSAGRREYELAIQMPAGSPAVLRNQKRPGDLCVGYVRSRDSGFLRDPSRR